MVMIHRAVRIVPTLHALRPVLRPVTRRVAPLRPPEGDEYLVLFVHLNQRVGLFPVHQHVALLQALFQKLLRFLREPFFQGIQKRDLLCSLYPPEALSRPPVVPDSQFPCLLEGRCESLLLVLVKTGPVDDMSQLMNEDALQPHSALVFHDVFLGKDDHRARPEPTQKAPASPVVKIQFLALFVGPELGNLGGQFGMSNQDAQHPLLPYSLGHLLVDRLHDLPEQIGRLGMGIIRDPIRGRDEDAFHLRPLLEELAVQFVSLELFFGQGLGLVLGLQGRRKNQKKRKNEQTQVHEKKYGLRVQGSHQPCGSPPERRSRNGDTGQKSDYCPRPWRSLPRAKIC